MSLPAPREHTPAAPRSGDLAHDAASILAAMRAQLEIAESLEDVRSLIDRAEVIRVAARKAKVAEEIQLDVEEYAIRAERKAGAMLREIELAKGGGAPEKQQDRDHRSPRGTSDVDLAPTLADRRSGIDVWLVDHKDGHMRGLASRVQWCDTSYDTFTVRIRSRYGGRTEYDKRRAEIAANRAAGRGGVLSPYYVTQGYVSKDRTRLVAAAIARMSDVIAAVEMDLGRPLPPNSDGSQGYAVSWDVLRGVGAPIRAWPDRVEGAA